MKKNIINFITLTSTIFLSILILCIALFAWFTDNEKVDSSFNSSVGSGDIRITKFELTDQNGEVVSGSEIHSLLLTEDIYFEIGIASLNEIDKELRLSFLSLDGGTPFESSDGVIYTDEAGKTYDMRDCFSIECVKVEGANANGEYNLSINDFIKEEYTGVKSLNELNNNMFCVFENWIPEDYSTISLKFKMTFSTTYLPQGVPINSVSNRSLSISSVIANGVNLE